MNKSDASARSEHFAQHWMVWLVVHHFLPGTLLRELLSVRRNASDERDLGTRAAGRRRPSLLTLAGTNAG